MRDMWRMVLLRGLIDAARGVDTDWLRSADFDLVCELAELDAETVLRQKRWAGCALASA
jgi:hypothetical protein